MVDILNQHLPNIKAPINGEKVYKDECAFSFDTPESEGGLFVCMNTFLAFGKKHVERHYKKSGNAVYLCLKRRRKEIVKDDESPPQKKPTKLAIGVEGGFDADKKTYEFEEDNSIVVLPEWTKISLPNADLPPLIQLSVSTMLTAEDAMKQEQAAAMAGTWEGEVRQVSRHAQALVQIPNGKKIPPIGWKCEKCDLTSNLWLNLTDGSILCGRRFFDGSGGNNHAVDSYAETRYPLAVKLGTITPQGADVFSYDEDDMVEDPLLSTHLSHFGINVAAMEKTEKTMLELEIDLNQRVLEWDVIQEAGSQLTPLYGPGYTGMRNLGNSCYLNSVMQVLFTLPDFIKRYCNKADEIFQHAPENPSSDFTVQMSKIGQGLMSGEYSTSQQDNVDQNLLAPSGIHPQMFKTLVGKGHVEFSTKKQQDAEEFMLHLFNLLERHNHGADNPTDCLKFQVQERVQCVQSKQVKYSTRSDYVMALPICLDEAVNKDDLILYECKKLELESQGKKVDPKDVVRPRIPFSSCLKSFGDTETVEDFFSSAIQSKTIAEKNTRLATFPDYLMVQLKKFTVNQDWTPTKLDVSVDVPDEIDLTFLRGHGLQPGEELLPDDLPSPPQIQIDDGLVGQLMDMGFAREGCRKAVYHTKNSGIEAAVAWVMEHATDPDFGEPLNLPSSQVSSGGGEEFVPSEDGMAMILSMGFTQAKCIKALKETDNNIERAVDWIFSHPDDEPALPMETGDPGPSDQDSFRDGAGKYKLVAFISHMGTSTMVGHYVCHILKEGHWVIFNDDKVALSEHPPRDLAYLYLFQRL